MSCLSDSKSKPRIKYRLGALDSKATNKAQPTYPDQAKQKRIAGVVKVEIVVDLSTGEIDWAKITSGHKLLQDAVRKVICQVKFPPTLDIDHRTKASGTLTYKFRVPPDSRDSNRSSVATKEQELAPLTSQPANSLEGTYVRPFLVALDAFRADPKIPETKRVIENYRIDLRQDTENYYVLFTARHEPDEKSLRGGESRLGVDVTYVVGKGDLKIRKREFYK